MRREADGYKINYIDTFGRSRLSARGRGSHLNVRRGHDDVRDSRGPEELAAVLHGLLTADPRVLRDVTRT